MNIARINANSAAAAYNEPRFTEISFQATDTEQRYLFATMAYQSSPVTASFLTISEAILKDEVWQGDRSQTFYAETEAFGQDYIKVLNIQKKPSKGEVKSAFTVFLSGTRDYLYRVEF